MTEAPVYYDADQAAAILHKTANWMRTKARKNLIPHTKIGRTPMWTPAHLKEIGDAREQRPRPAATGRSPAHRKPPVTDIPMLQARTPRRKLA